MTHFPLDRIELLKAARRVADFASNQGVSSTFVARRSTYVHVGALLADAVLQAGLSYRSVVLPRVRRILKEFPNADRVGTLICIVKEGDSSNFLNWQHPTKTVRFERLVSYLYESKVDTTEDIREALKCDKFCTELESLHGVGPKTIDYMGCLVGIESIAVDRHIRTFAIRAGVIIDDYNFLKNTFCCAADLLSISRREFDAWVWSREAYKQPKQLDLAF